MRKFIDLAKRFRREEDGAALIEYTVLLGIIAATVILTIVGVGTWINTEWSDFASAIGATPAPAP